MVVQACFIGAWGEWYYTDNFGFPPNSTDLANRKLIIDAILKALTLDRAIQLRTPNHNIKYEKIDLISYYIAKGVPKPKE
jgi:hypothetical protein